MGYTDSFDFDKDSLTWTTDGANAGSVFIRHGKFNCTNVCGILTPRYNDINLHFFNYSVGYSALNSRREDILGYKVMSYEMAAIKVTLPPLSDQQAIASYLDAKCSAIDDIIASVRISIDDYKQLKASTIYEAVTKGLNPDVEMKDSGVEWIGFYPEAWKIIRIKYLLYEVNERSEYGTEESLSMSQVLGIVPSSLISVANPASSYIGNKLVKKNDLVFNKLKAHLGVFAVSKYDGLVSPDYAVYRAVNDCELKFLEYLFKTSRCISEFKKYITGVGSGLSRLYTSDLYNIKVAIPSSKEQSAIVRYLDTRCAEIDSLIAEKEALIADLEAYKKSLIYECVTGKRRVA